MISLLRNEGNSAEIGLEAAKSAAPYVHARLRTTELTTPGDDLPSEDMILERIESILQANPDLRARVAPAN